MRNAISSRIGSEPAVATDREPGGAPRPLVYFLAPAGHPNYGDELILSMWLRTVRHLWPHARVVVDCHTPGQAAVLHRDTHPDITVTDTVWRLVADSLAEGDCPADTVAFVRRALTDRGTRPGLSDGIDLLLSADVVHVVGGGFVNTQWPHHVGVYAAAGACANLAGARVVATGQGLCPPLAARDLGAALEGFTLLTVRDRASYDVATGPEVSLEGIDIRLATDDAWLAHCDLTHASDIHHRPLLCPDPEWARPVVVCLQSDLTDVTKVEASAAQLLETWDVSGHDITVIEGIPGADRVVWDRLVAADEQSGSGSKNWRQARFMPFTEVWSRGLPARPGQAWLTSRFHPHLMAAATGAGGVALSVSSDYYAVKHGSLTAAGSPWDVVTVPGQSCPSAETRSSVVSTGGFGERDRRALAGAAEQLARDIYT